MVEFNKPHPNAVCKILFTVVRGWESLLAEGQIHGYETAEKS